MVGLRVQREIWNFVILLLLTLSASALFAVVFYPEHGWLTATFIGVASGLTIGTPVILWFLSLQSALGRRLRRLPLAANFALSSTVIASLLCAGHYLAYRFFWPVNPQGFLGATMVSESMLFSILMSCAISYSLELRRLIGPGVFGAFLFGRYRYPRTEQRLLLLLDLVGSTALAERIGAERFLGFIDQWIHDLTDPLMAAEGQIYRYIGDEIILTWPYSPHAAERALVLVQALTARLAANAEAYRRQFGEAPLMRVAMHAGPVVTGEVGDIKREITYLGDTVNTAARIAGECRQHQALVLASAQSLRGVVLPSGLSRYDLGAVPLRGRSEPVALALVRQQ